MKGRLSSIFHSCVFSPSYSAYSPFPPFATSPFRHLLLGFTVLLFLDLSLECNAGISNLQPVRFTHGKRNVPTYTFGRSETVAPLFGAIENMGYYPYTRLDWDSRARKPVSVEYESLVLENEYLRVEFLPELGGRIWSAYDKLASRQIFYHPTVIKPGRYNQRGGWPVGNLELYGPFDAHMLTWPGEAWPWAFERHPNGSATVVLSHIDHFFRDKVVLEVTLYPGRAFLETTIRLYNKNLLPNRYLLWTNAGVAATEGSRFIYPMTKTIGHDSSVLGTWPFIEGVDLSWNKNNKNMLGVFGLDIFDNFMSIYDYKADYGTICYTNRLLARGMKTWTFGSGLTALRHMAAYTDKDGLYMETQSGRFIWDGNYEFINPGKTDGWTEYWYGAGQLGGLTTATRDAAVFLEIPAQRPGNASLSVAPTGIFPQSTLELWAQDVKLWSAKQNLRIGQAYRASIPLPSQSVGKILNLRIRSQSGELLVDHRVFPDGSHPEAVYASESIPRTFGPVDSLTVEEIYQKGLGHEKFGQITDAEEAYRSALSKDALYSPVHLRLGLLALERFEVSEAAEHFEKVLQRDPTNGDAHYYLAVISADLGKELDAQRHFYRLLPSSEKFDRRDYGLALLALSGNNWQEAARKLRAASSLTPSDLSVRQAQAYLLRKVGHSLEARREREAILKLDPTNSFAHAEELFSQMPVPAVSDSARKSVTAKSTPSAATLLDRSCARHPQVYLELATDYLRLSAWLEAGQVLERGIQVATSSGKIPDPLLLYYRAYVAGKENNKRTAQQFIARAKQQDFQLEIFPFRSEDVRVLRYVLEVEPGDANAAVLLGDLLYSRKRGHDAIDLWRKAVEVEPRHFYALRDLGMAMLVDEKNQEGLKLLTRASEARPEHMATTVLVANINARLGNADAARQAFQRALERKPGNDGLIERLSSVEAQFGNFSKALELLNNHTFEPTHQSYSLLHLYRGLRLMMALESFKKAGLQEALLHMRAATQPPSSLGVDDFATVKSSRLLVFEALLQEAGGDSAAARSAWTAAASTMDDDVEGEGLFRAIALLKTGQTQKAESWLKEFTAINEQRTRDSAVDLRLHAYGMAGIYAAWQGDDKQAMANFRKALEIDQSYLYARQCQAWLEGGLLRGLRK